MSRKLLLADDSITIQKVIQITFAHEDYELTITDNGDAAFAKAQEIRPDLIMADVYMPGRNGYELCAAVKQDPALRGVPVLLLAGSFEPFDEEKAKNSRADAWLEKPFESQVLLDKVAELLSASPVIESAAPAMPADAPEAAAPSEPAPEVIAEPAGEEPVTAAPPAIDDPFADISFEEEEPLVEEPLTESAVDDWSDLTTAASSSEPAASETAETFTFAPEEAAPAADLADFGVVEEPADEETAFAGDDDFTFVEETAEADVEFDTLEELEEVMPLGDEDILGAEDLEPAPEEPTLASWSRDEIGGDDVFAEPLAAEPVTDIPDVSEELFEAEEEMIIDEEPLPSFDSDVSAPPETPVYESSIEPEAPEMPMEEVEEDIEPAAMSTSLEEIEEKVVGLSDADLEAIVEKVAGRMIEKLADTILERVAWEVVPDLAENLIREEIRKIKESAA